MLSKIEFWARREEGFNKRNDRKMEKTRDVKKSYNLMKTVNPLIQKAQQTLNIRHMKKTI